MKKILSITLGLVVLAGLAVSAVYAAPAAGFGPGSNNQAMQGPMQSQMTQGMVPGGAAAPMQQNTQNQFAEGYVPGQNAAVMQGAMQTAMAEILGLDPLELAARIEAGETFYDIALSLGYTVEQIPDLMASIRELAFSTAGIDWPQMGTNLSDPDFTPGTQTGMGGRMGGRR